jgi:hypothetical protein
MDQRNDDLLPRRRFLALGGLTVATAAIVAACGEDEEEDNVPSAGVPTPTTGLAERQIDDIELLRTASSLERSVASAYDSLLPLTAGATADALTLFRERHLAHAASFDTLTEQEGGEPFGESNPALQAELIEPTLAVIEGQTDPEQQAASIVVFAHSLENVATSTFQSFVPTLIKPELRSAIAGIGTVEAMHSAVLAGLIEGAQPAAGLDTLDAAATTLPATTTTAAAPPNGTGATTTTSPALALPADGVFQVPGSFGSLAEALGPNSYMYDERTLVTTAEG